MENTQKHTHLPHDHGQALERTPDMIPRAEEFQVVADLFKKIGDGSRARIFWILCHAEECVMNISELVGMTSPAVSHHLKLLKDSDLIVSRRDGKEVYYRAADTVIVHMLHKMIECLMEIACPMVSFENHRD